MSENQSDTPITQKPSSVEQIKEGLKNIANDQSKTPNQQKIAENLIKDINGQLAKPENNK